MVTKLRGAAAPGAVAPEATNENARELAGNTGVRAGFSEGSDQILGGFSRADKPFPGVDADLAAFELLKVAATRNGWGLTADLLQPCTCGPHSRAADCPACVAWAAVPGRLAANKMAMTAQQPPLSFPKAAAAVLRIPQNAVRLRSIGRAAWVLDYEIEESRR